MTTWKQVVLAQQALWPSQPWDPIVGAMLSELAADGFGPGGRGHAEPEDAHMALMRMAREANYLAFPPTPAAVIERAEDIAIERRPRLAGASWEMSEDALNRARDVYLAWAKKRTPQQLTEYHERVARYARFGMRGMVQLGRSQPPVRESPPEPPETAQEPPDGGGPTGRAGRRIPGRRGRPERS